MDRCQSEENPQVIIIVSSDKTHHAVRYDAFVKFSGLVKGWIEQEKEDFGCKRFTHSDTEEDEKHEALTLPFEELFDNETLTHVIEYIEWHYDNMSADEEQKCAFDNNFLQKFENDKNVLFNILHVANTLEIAQLLTLTCKEMVRKMKQCKDLKDIGTFLGVKNGIIKNFL